MNMNQLLLGASIPFVIAAVIYSLHGFRAGFRLLVITPIAMMIMALWAVGPDLTRLVGATDLYLKLSEDPRMNIFLWHYSIDQVEVDSPWYAAGFVVMYACLLAAAWRELRIFEKENEVVQ